MSTRFRWNVGADHAAHPGGAVDVEIAATASATHRPTRFALTRGFVAAYAFALAAAAGGGFGLGRWSEAHGAIVAGVDDGLSVEALAWSDGDIGLYEARLDPLADERWRTRTLAEFVRSSPRAWSASIVSLSVGEAEVIVEIEIVAAAAGGEGGTEAASDAGVPERWREQRVYRSIGGTYVWRSAPEVGAWSGDG